MPKLEKGQFWWDRKILLPVRGGLFSLGSLQSPFQPNFFYDYLPDLQGTTAVDVTTDQPWAILTLLIRSCILTTAQKAVSNGYRHV